jgi:hypothetical protein
MPKQPIYLFSAFSKTTILYLPQEITQEEHGRLVIISNDAIRVLEIKSGRIDETKSVLA